MERNFTSMEQMLTYNRNQYKLRHAKNKPNQPTNYKEVLNNAGYSNTFFKPEFMR